ncbi:MAG: tetratricopeptide repeat protein [Bacteroidia bacterium]|nr:tetratricopeptide repeat protein [Bacteroidia bacterium]
MKRLIKILLLFLFLITRFVSPAQNIDSLKRELRTQKADTESVFILLNIAEHYSNKGLADTSFGYYNAAVSKAQKISNKKFLGSVYYYMGRAYSGAGKEAIGRFYLKQSVSVFKKANRISKLDDVYNSIGVTYYYEGKYDSAIVYYNQAADYALQDKDSLSVARCYNNIGVMYDIKGEVVKSVQSYIKAVKIYEDNKREDLCIGPFQNIALVYINNKQHSEALKNLEAAKKIAIKYKDNKTLIQIYNSMGSALDDLGKPGEANVLFKKALALARDEKDEALSATVLNNLGENTMLMKKYDEAENLLLECVELKKKLNNPVSLGITEICLGQALVNTKKYTQATAAFSSGLAKVKDAGHLQYQKIGLEGLALAYEKSGNYKDAYSNLDAFVKLNDTLLKESNNKIISELQTKYQSDKKEAEIQLLTKNQQLQSEEIKRKQNEIKYALGAGGLVLILLIFVVISWRNKQRANKALAEKNAEINLQKEIIEEKQKEVMDSIRYAKRIQQSLLPTEKYIARNLTDLNKKP